MLRDLKPGRPRQARCEAAGRNLRQALKLLGKTWRKNTGDPDHILQWDAWAAQGLPRSPSTIDADIAKGIPEERIDAYAKCLGVARHVLVSPDSDMRGVMGASPDRRDQDSAPLDFCYGPAFQEKYLYYNSPRYIQDLFALIRGVYIVHYTSPCLDVILKCSLYIHDAERHFIRAKGLFAVFGLDNLTTANIFRWHNNLHSVFHCQNMMELGHYLTIDPLRHHLVARREPFWLRGQGVTDNGQAANIPVPFTFLMEKLPADGGDLDGFWRKQCQDLRGRPCIAQADPDFEPVKARVEAPETF